MSVFKYISFSCVYLFCLYVFVFLCTVIFLVFFFFLRKICLYVFLCVSIHCILFSIGGNKDTFIHSFFWLISFPVRRNLSLFEFGKQEIITGSQVRWETIHLFQTQEPRSQCMPYEREHYHAEGASTVFKGGVS